MMSPPTINDISTEIQTSISSLQSGGGSQYALLEQSIEQHTPINSTSTC